MKKILFVALLFISVGAQAQKIMSNVPCAGSEVFQCREIVGDFESVNWEELIVCDLIPKDVSTWSIYYNYKGNKGGNIKMKILSYNLEKESFYLLLLMPKTNHKYRVTLTGKGKDIKMSLVEGNLSKPYNKEFEKLQ